MVEKRNKNRTWFRFIDKNRVYDYKSLYNAVLWAETKVRTSTSGEIRVFKVKRLSRGGLELQCLAFTRLNQSGSMTTAWRDVDVYREYKEKEDRVRSEGSKASRDHERVSNSPRSNRSA